VRHSLPLAGRLGYASRGRMTLSSWLAVLVGFTLLLGGLAALTTGGARTLGVAALLVGLASIALAGWLVESRRAFEVIHVVSGQYGRSCSAPEGNATPFLQRACEQRQQVCFYRVDHSAIGDPCWGQHKDFVAQWRCGEQEHVHELWVPAEASAKELALHCPEGTGEVSQTVGERLPLLGALAPEQPADAAATP
jgi:hypothetical protein